MNTVLFFFALPVATIILSIVLQKILRNAFLTAATFLAIYLILAFTAFDESFLVFANAYTILSFVTAIIAEFIFERCENRNVCWHRNCAYSCTSMNNANIRNITNSNGTNLNNTSSQINENSPLMNNMSNQSNCINANNRPNTIAVNVRDTNNASNNSSWCCYRR